MATWIPILCSQVACILHVYRLRCVLQHGAHGRLHIHHAHLLVVLACCVMCAHLALTSHALFMCCACAEVMPHSAALNRACAHACPLCTGHSCGHFYRIVCACEKHLLACGSSSGLPLLLLVLRKPPPGPPKPLPGPPGPPRGSFYGLSVMGCKHFSEKIKQLSAQFFVNRYFALAQYTTQDHLLLNAFALEPETEQRKLRVHTTPNLFWKRLKSWCFTSRSKKQHEFESWFVTSRSKTTEEVWNLFVYV